MTLEATVRLLWAAQGTALRRGGRTAPSAGALYPLEIHLAAGNVTGLESGVYRYAAAAHALSLERSGDARDELAVAAGQAWIAESAAVLLIAAVYARTTVRYGRRGERYVQMECGHAAQNVCLEAVSLGLATVVVGAFEDGEVKRLAGLPADEAPLVLLPIGHG